MSMDFDASDFLRHLTQHEARVRTNATTSLHDTTDDLLRISRDLAPVDSADLRRSGSTRFFMSPTKFTGEVSFGVTKGNFNYAYKMHESDYNLGPTSAGAGGTDGYNVGKKFLQRPLEGESAKYMTWITEAILRGLDG
jgi:hypothetical protein